MRLTNQCHRHVSRQGFDEKGLSPWILFFLGTTEKGRFFNQIYLPFSSVDKAANFACVKYHLRSGAINQLILPTNVSSKYDRYVTFLAVLPIATNTQLQCVITDGKSGNLCSVIAFGAWQSQEPRKMRYRNRIAKQSPNTYWNKSAMRQIAPVRGDVTNGKGQRVTKLPEVA